MRRLYLQIYGTVVASIVVFALIAGYFWRHVQDPGVPGRGGRTMAELVATTLPPAGEPADQQRAALERLRARVPSDLALYASDGQLIASAGGPVPPPEIDRGVSGWVGRPGRRPAWSIALPDGRWLVVRLTREFRPPVFNLAAFLALLALVIAVAAYPVVRRMTRRLERLQQGVEALGAGQLSARVPIEGRDEVAALARSFNDAAARIEQLLGSHRTMLANASHELRSPLARIQMGVAMVKADARPDIAAELEQSIAELDALVEEILLASRLDAVPDAGVNEEVDLLALLAEECARVGAALEGVPATIAGDPRLLRRLMRNLLENARRHGGETPIEATLRPGGDGKVDVSICDGGPGVPVAERERIFEPFYRLAGTRESAGGAGLGLALARTIARRHGGGIRYADRPGGGACFTAELATANPRS